MPSTYRFDGMRIYNRVNKNNDGFHFNSSQYVNIVNCNVQCQDDAVRAVRQQQVRRR